VDGDAWLAVRFVHVVAMAFFVGGQLMLAAAVVPALRGGDRDGLRAVARRFGWGTLAAIGVLIATGAAMASHYSLWDSSTLRWKLGLVALTAGLVVWHMRRPSMHVLEGLIFLASLAIVWLGLSLAH
jgi:uncharacterized membrane protein